MAWIEVRVLEPDELTAWDEVVAGSLQGTVFHTSDWLQETASSLNRRLVILGCYEDEVLIGGCPLLLSNPYGLLRIASSAAMLAPYGGMVIAGVESTNKRKRESYGGKVVESVRDHIVRERFDSVDLVNSPAFTDIRGFTRGGWGATVYYTHMLPADGEDLFDRITKNTRNSIRKAQRQGITVTEHFDAEVYWALTMDTFKRQHMNPPFSRQHLLSLLETIQRKNLGEMWVAMTPSGEIIAAEVVVCDKKTAHRWSAASLEEHLSTGATSLLLSEVITHFAGGSCSSVNLMGGNMARLSAFVSGFNPDLVPYYGVELSGTRYRIVDRLNNRMKGVVSRLASRGER